jgi:hypothetical protein
VTQKSVAKLRLLRLTFATKFHVGFQRRRFRRET